VLSEPVQLVAIVGGRLSPKLATVEVQPEDWHGGHPLGAVLMKPVDLDCSQMKKAPTIEGWRVVSADGVASDQYLPSRSAWNRR
jgi:hypothetical protein